MIRLLLLAILFFLAYTFITAVLRTLVGRRSSLPPEKTRRGEEMVRDPQCGVYLPRGEAQEKVIGGEKVYFCSSECQAAFRAGKEKKP